MVSLPLSKYALSYPQSPSSCDAGRCWTAHGMGDEGLARLPWLSQKAGHLLPESGGLGVKLWKAKPELGRTAVWSSGHDGVIQNFPFITIKWCMCWTPAFWLLGGKNRPSLQPWPAGLGATGDEWGHFEILLGSELTVGVFSFGKSVNSFEFVLFFVFVLFSVKNQEMCLELSTVHRRAGTPGWVGNYLVNSWNDGEETLFSKSIKCLL